MNLQNLSTSKHMYISVETDGSPSFLSQRIIRVALVLTDAYHQVLSLESFFVHGATKLGYNPNGYSLTQVNSGLLPRDAGFHLLKRLHYIQANHGTVVAHNLQFVEQQLVQLGLYLPGLGLDKNQLVCVMKKTTDVCKLEHPSDQQQPKYKYPKLTELCQFLGLESEDLQRAENKAWAIQNCYKTLIKNNML